MPAPKKKSAPRGVLGGDLRNYGALGFFDDQAAEEAALAEYAGRPLPASPGFVDRLRGTNLYQMGADAVDAAALPGDVYAGRARAEDVIDRSNALAGLATLGAGAFPAEAGALRMGARFVDDFSGAGGTPNISTGVDYGREVLRKKAAEMELDPKKRTQPNDQEPVFDTSRDAYERTKFIVPQRDFTSSYPTLFTDGRGAPLNNRMFPLLEARDEIAKRYAERSKHGLGAENQYFYNTGPIYEGVERVAPGEAAAFMDRFSRGMASTSPRTATEANLRSQSLLDYKTAQGLDLNAPVMPTGTANDIGYPMMDMHRNLYRDMQEGNFNFDKNPKPNAFRENLRGNLQGVTADTHNIRGVLLSYDDINPGQIPKEWFTSGKVYEEYKKGGLTPEILKSGINDTLKSAADAGVDRQVEYGPIASITHSMADQMGVSPAEAQALGWFGSGAETNLASAVKTVPTLMNERINVTAQALGLPPDVVLKMYVRGEIPLMGVAGAAIGAGVAAQPGGPLSKKEQEAYDRGDLS